MELRDPEFNRFFSEALKLLSTRRRICGDFIFRGFIRVFLFSFLSFCFLSLSFFQTDFSFASESHSSSRSLSPGGACNKVLIKVGALEAEQSSAQQQSSASDLDNSEKYPWLKPPVPKGFWDIPENQKAYIEWLGEKLGYTKPEHWYQVTKELIIANSGKGLLKKFRGSPLEMVRALVEAPDGGWKPWKFKKVPEGFWDNEENQKAYIEWLGKKLGLSTHKDWYGLTKEIIIANRGSGLLTKKFNSSPLEMVMALVEAPDGGWKPWKFTNAPQGFWDNEANQKAYMKWLGEKLKFSKPEDWYGLTGEMIRANSGLGLLKKFRGSPAEMVMALVEAPDGGWKPWEFKKGPNGLFDIPENQKAYIEWLGKKLGYTKPEDWYGLTGEMIRANSGKGLLKKFRGSPLEMVRALVEAPEGGWRPWLFGGAKIWDEKENQKEYMEWLGEKLGFSTHKDWYGLTGEIIIANSGGGLLPRYFKGSPAEMVMALVEAPEGGWVKEKFYDLSKMERLMGDFLVRWFNGLSKPSFNDRKTHGLKFKESGHGMEADVLFEDLKFVIEYHGGQHYKPVENWGGQVELENIQRRDREKREAFKNAGYIYIEIPHYEWARGDEVALKNLILEQLKEYKDSSDFEVKAQAWFIEEVLQKSTNNEDNTSEDIASEDNASEAIAGTNNESLPMIQPFGESDLSGSESDPATSPNTASGGR